MKIRKIGWNSFLISGNDISALTDPLETYKVLGSFSKSKADICLFTKYDKAIKKGIVEDNNLETKVLPEKREKIIEIYSPGEYEAGGLMIRRGIGDDFYIIDEGTLRILYMGGIDNTFDPKRVKGFGDVDVVILPVGDGEKYLSFENIERVLSNTDPAILIPCIYKGEGKSSEGLKGKEEFIKHFGFANVREENYLNVDRRKVEMDQQSVEVVFLN